MAGESVRPMSWLWPQRNGPSDCLSKTQVCAKSDGRRIQTDACPMPEGQKDELAARRSLELKPR